MSKIIQINAIKAIITREIIVFVREKERIVSSIISPLLFLFVIGRSLNQKITIEGYTYQQFIFPGIIAMNILFTSIRYGLYLIWDKRVDFLKEVLVAPISRTSLFIGKAAGGVIGAILEMIILISIGNFFVLKLSIIQIILTIIVSFVSSFMIVSIGLSIGAVMKTMEGFGLIMSFITWPMFFFSNALFEVKSTSYIIMLISRINPFTYSVDILRKIMLDYSTFKLSYSISILIFSTLVLSYITTKLFERIDIQK